MPKNSNLPKEHIKNYTLVVPVNHTGFPVFTQQDITLKIQIAYVCK